MTSRMLCLGVSAILLTGAAGLGQQAEPGVQAPGAEAWVRYDGHKAVRVFLTRAADAMAVTSISSDMLNCEPRPGYMDVRFSPEEFDVFLTLGLRHEILIDDMQIAIDAEARRLGLGPWAGQGAPAPDGSWYLDFKTYAQVHQRVDDLVAEFPQMTEHSIIGQTIQGRDIKMVRVSPPGASPTRPAMFIVGTQHAREWVSPMVTMYTMEELLRGYGSNQRITDLMDRVEFFFVPIANGDGYEFSWTTNRMWRKNRRVNQGSSCLGVDLNRNWDIMWGQQGSSADPCNDTFRGGGAFSEPEVEVIANAMLAIGPRIRAHIDVHSYGQLILYPYGWTAASPPDAVMFQEVCGRDMVDAIASVHGRGYTPGSGSTTLYFVSGGAKDWSYDALNAIGMTVELRPVGSPGFILPAEEIIPNGEEFFEGVLSLATNIARPLIMTIPEAMPAAVQVGVPFEQRMRIFETAETYQPGTAVLHWRPSPSESFRSEAMTDNGDGSFSATILPTHCGQAYEFYFEARTDAGTTVLYPEGGASNPVAVPTGRSTVVFHDDFSTNLGWTFGAFDDDAVRGIWNRMMPQQTQSGSNVAQPGFTPTGTACLVTDGRAGSSAGSWDVDEGKTTVFSPVLDLAGLDPLVSYHRWYSNHAGNNPYNDIFVVDVSNDGGQSWTRLETVGPGGPQASGEWYRVEYRVSDFVAPTSQIQFRFIASDYDPQALVEALVDDFRVAEEICNPLCYADCDNSAVLDIFDFLCFQNAYAVQAPYADCDGNNQFDVFDFLCFGNAFARGCP